MKKFLAIMAAIIFLTNTSYAAEKNLDDLLNEQREIVKKLQERKGSSEETQKLKSRVAELEKQISELKEEKSLDDTPKVDEINKKIEELKAQQERLAELIKRLEKLEAEKNSVPETRETLVKPQNRNKINYTQDAANSQGNSTMTFHYAPNQLYKIYCRVGYLTDLSFKRGEKINFVGGGDTSAWAVNSTTVDGVAHVYIKPIVETSTTNLIVTTNKRSYQLILNTSEWYNPMVTWTYGVEEAEENLIQQAKDEQTITATFKGGTENLNFNYKVSGKSNDIKPQIVFDDGERTIIKFGKLPAKLPTLFIKERNKSGVSMANYEIKGDSYILDRLAEEMELRGSSKKEVIKIKRTSNRG